MSDLPKIVHIDDRAVFVLFGVDRAGRGRQVLNAAQQNGQTHERMPSSAV